VLDAEKRNKRQIAVTFNYRYAPRHEKIKEILMSGELGRVMSVAFDWHLDNGHGADYFRRWHRLKKMSGSLLVHKSSHHFDLMNWWLSADPVEVMAYGQVGRYGKSGPFRSTNCRVCPHKKQCAYYWDITKDERLSSLYVAAESEDGYFRDGCVFREDVDSYDTMSALVRYSNGTVMNYSLNAYMPFEGYDLVFTCEKGTLQVKLTERVQPTDRLEMVVTKSFGKREVIDLPQQGAGHGGGDDRLRDLIFRKARLPPYLQLPTSRAGAMACLTGIGARRSIEEKRPVKIADLIKI
jgi:predicted dehydrogenase